MNIQSAALGFALALFATSDVVAAPNGPPASNAARTAPQQAHAGPLASPGDAPPSGLSDGEAAAQPQVSQDAPARSRMHECGHQWSAMKKAGTVGTLTWKEFSATCLVVSK